MLLAPDGDDWLTLGGDTLVVDPFASWAVQPSCGAVVVFFGTVRDHAEGRPGVISLEYEAYSEAALQKMRSVVTHLRRRWDTAGRVALAHRTGELHPTDISVIVVVSAPHRAEAFEAARFGIDAVKATVPIWKRETWDGGTSWGLGPSRGRRRIAPSTRGQSVSHQAVPGLGATCTG